MLVTILGSGTSTGVPVIGCDCSVCKSRLSKNQRTRSSVCINTDHNQTIVIDTGPEFRIQVLREGIQRVDAVLYTHLHADHCHGFDDLRAFHFRGGSQQIPAYLASDFLVEFKQRFAYAFMDTGYLGTKPRIDLRATPDQGMFMIGQTEVETCRLPHGPEHTSAYRIGKFAYATDFKSFSSEQIAAWKGKVEVMVASGIHFGNHATHSSIPETIALFEKLGVKRGIITHLSHEVEYLEDSARLPSGVEFAYDGMQVDVG